MPRSFDCPGGRITRTHELVTGQVRYFLHAEGRNEPVEVSESYAQQMYEESFTLR